MPLGRKTKIESRWSAINKMVLEGLDDEQEFISQLLADPVLKALNHDMTVILGAIRSKAANNSGNVNAIQDPVTVPIPLNRYMGVLHFDTTTKGQKTGMWYIRMTTPVLSGSTRKRSGIAWTRC